MRKTLGFAIITAAVIATGLTPAVGWAATTSATTFSLPAPADPDTTVTFTVTSGELTLTAPVSSDLGSGIPGTNISHALGAVTVTDDRAALDAAWTATASSTSFTTGAASPDETIPASDVGYSPGTITTTGSITATGSDITLSGSAQTVVAGTAGVGNNTAGWDPGLVVAVPAAGVGGDYTGTLTQSVS